LKEVVLKRTTHILPVYQRMAAKWSATKWANQIAEWFMCTFKAQPMWLKAQPMWLKAQPTWHKAQPM
jgi:hypothetical protein